MAIWKMKIFMHELLEKVQIGDKCLIRHNINEIYQFSINQSLIWRVTKQAKYINFYMVYIDMNNRWRKLY